MSQSLSYAELIALKPCNALGQKYLFKNAERLTARGALAAGASLSDLLWVAGRLGLKRECVQFALACARRAAHLNPDPRVGAALDAAQAWLDEPSNETANAANAAAYAAAGRATAARAAVASAAAAANAAYAAARTAATAATYVDYAALAAAAAFTAARAADYVTERAEQKRIFLEIFDPQGEVIITDKEGA